MGHGKIAVHYREPFSFVTSTIWSWDVRCARPKERMKLTSNLGGHLFFLLQKMDLNKDGYVSLEEFLTTCQTDDTVRESVQAFTGVSI